MADNGYLVVQCAKKGFREFKSNELKDKRSTWDSRIEWATKFDISRLEELVRWIDSKPRVWYIWFVLDGKSMTLHKHKFDLQFGTKRMKLKKEGKKNG